MRDINSISPFTPNGIVLPDLFVGRTQQINETINRVNILSIARFFLIGEKGLGKSSFASYVLDKAHKERKIWGLHISLNNVSTIDNMLDLIVDNLKNIKYWRPFELESINLSNVKITPTDKDKLLSPIREKTNQIFTLIREIKKYRKNDAKGEKGLFLVLDDIHLLIQNENFFSWCSNFLKNLEILNKEFPIFFMLTGLEEDKKTLYSKNTELFKSFHFIEIKNILTDEEIREFLNKAFKKIKKTSLQPGVIDIIVKYSKGPPRLMHKIGADTLLYYEDKKNLPMHMSKEIDKNDAVRAIISVAEIECSDLLKTFDPRDYQSILEKLFSFPPYGYFSQKDILSKVGNYGYKLTSLLNELVLKKIIKKSFGKYQFANELYPVYIWKRLHIPTTEKEMNVVTDGEKILQKCREIYETIQKNKVDKICTQLMLGMINQHQAKIIDKTDHNGGYDHYYDAKKYIQFIYADMLIEKCKYTQKQIGKNNACPLFFLSCFPEYIKFLDKLTIHEFIKYKAFLRWKNTQKDEPEYNYYLELENLEECSWKHCPDLHEEWTKVMRNVLLNRGNIETKIEQIKADNHKSRHDKRSIIFLYKNLDKLTLGKKISKKETEKLVNFFWDKEGLKTNTITMLEFLLRCPVIKYEKSLHSQDTQHPKPIKPFTTKHTGPSVLWAAP